MNREQANTLADRITHTWPRGGISLDTWGEVLEDMHHGPAEAAWRQLRDTQDHQPSIAMFRSTYQAQLGTAHEPHFACDTCGGDGWVSRTYTVLNIEYSGLKPCNCRNGDLVLDVHRRIVAANDAELAPYVRARTDDAVPRPRWLTAVKTPPAAPQ